MTGASKHPADGRDDDAIRPAPPGLTIVRAAAGLVPWARRADWVAEWEGELGHRWSQRPTSSAGAFLLMLALTLRALGALSDAWSIRRRIMETPMIANDVRYALRTLIRRPGFSVIVIVTLALGIGATTAIFSVVNAVLLRALPYENPERLVTLRGVPTEGDASKVSPSSSWPDFVDYRSTARSFDELAAFGESVVTLTGPGLEPTSVPAASVTSNLFRTLGATPASGRALGAMDEAAGQARVAIASHELARTLGGPALGRTITVDGISHVIIGVMPERFDFPTGARLWVPLAPEGSALERGVHNLQVIGRLRDGVTREAATAEARSIFRALEAQYPESNTRRSAIIDPLGESAVRGVRPILLLLLGAVGLVLLIVCTNVASLFLARAASREREVALRIALGAGRGRIARQMLVESVLLSLTGGVLGLALAVWGVDIILAAAPGSLPIAGDVGVDLRVLAFVLGISVLTGIAFGATPAIHMSRLDANAPLKEASHTVTAARSSRRARQLLVVAEVSLAMVLVLGAGTLVATVARLQRVDPGFDPHQMMVTRIELPPARYSSPAKVLAYYDALRARLEQIAGVEAAFAYEHPLSPGWTTSFAIPGRTAPPAGEEPEARVRPITPGYLDAAGVQLVRGRDITDRDRSGAPGAIIVNEAFARRHFPGEDPIGNRLEIGSWMPETPQSFEIVGMIRDERFLGLSAEADPAAYFPHAQFPLNDMYLVLRTTRGASEMVPLLRDAIRSVDSEIPLERVTPMDELLGGTLARPRFVRMLLALFAGAALLLAAVGIYGILSYTVAQRTAEIGLRMALGASRGAVMRAIVGQGMLLALAGIAIGTAAAAALSRTMSRTLVEAIPPDPAIFAVVGGILALTALVAAFVPAHRASRVDPLVALRQG